MKESFVAGRIAVYVPDHPACNNMGYVLRSRYVVEQSLGRYLESNEEVHHKDENSLNDDLENLEVKTKAEHTAHHARLRRTLDYDTIRELMSRGWGYKRIAKGMSIPVYSAKYACRVIKAENLGAK